ncbi:MAG: chemotaxis protein CheW [Spirochaetaceae bacterium]|jgi:purine-binding chemotaxis protein CheW|nr:chemotaxis protein CheW [Spirochaetaceae bacterium]
MSRQFLSFVLDGALYAVEVAQVQEVLEYTQPVRLPCTIDYVEGLISSREQGISVVNLRKKFELKTVEPTKKTRIIIIEINHVDGDNVSVVTFGAIADSVEEVIDLEEDTIEPAPKFGNNISGEYIRGIGKKDNKFIIILDIDKVFSTEEIVALKAAVVK